MWLVSSSLSFAAGPPIGGLLITGFGWRAICFINVPLALCGMTLARRYATETHGARERPLDAPGRGLAVGSPAAASLTGFVVVETAVLCAWMER
jgi:MFS transporter, DHA2 family, methylenomycin A resistance protein